MYILTTFFFFFFLNGHVESLILVSVGFLLWMTIKKNQWFVPHLHPTTDPFSNPTRSFLCVVWFGSELMFSPNMLYVWTQPNFELHWLKAAGGGGGVKVWPASFVYIKHMQPTTTETGYVDNFHFGFIIIYLWVVCYFKKEVLPAECFPCFVLPH